MGKLRAKAFIEIEVDLSCMASIGKLAVYDKSQEQWYPGEAGKTWGLTVMWNGQEIQDQLPEELKADLLEELTEEGVFDD